KPVEINRPRKRIGVGFSTATTVPCPSTEAVALMGSRSCSLLSFGLQFAGPELAYPPLLVLPVAAHKSQDHSPFILSGTQRRLAHGWLSAQLLLDNFRSRRGSF